MCVSKPEADQRGRSRVCLLLLAVIACSVGMLPAAVFGAGKAVDGTSLLPVSDTVLLGALPAYRELTPEGVALVIDLRYPYEGVYEDMGSLKSRGIRVLNIPVSSKGPTAENVAELEAALAAAAGQRVLIHDSNGHRTAALWGAHLLANGETLEAVLTELAPLHQSDELEQTLARYARTVETSR